MLLKRSKYLLILPICMLPVFIMFAAIYLSEMNNPRKDLSDAIKAGNILTVKQILVENNYLINSIREGKTPLLEAISYKKAEIAESLIKDGANVNTTGGRHHYPPITGAAAQGQVNTIMLLLNAGASINQKDDLGETALMAAVQNGHFEAVKLLLDSGADINIRSYYFPNTALEYAVEFCHPDVLNLLILNKATYDFNALSPLVRARMKGITNQAIAKKYERVLEILKNGGAHGGAQRDGSPAGRAQRDALN